MTIEKRYYTHSDFKQSVKKIESSINNDSWTPQTVIGISRGGLPLGLYLSHCFDIPLVPIMLSLRDHTSNNVKDQLKMIDFHENQNILITDDILDSGATIKQIKQDITDYIERDPAYLFEKPLIDVRIATSLVNISNEMDIQPEYFGETLDRNTDNRWIVFDYEELR